MSYTDRKQATLLVALCAATLMVYFPAWHGDFVYDDLWYIVRNPFMHHSLLWRSLFTDSWTTAVPASGLNNDVYRPLTTLWFWLDAHLWGPLTFPYHLENLLLHMTNGLLLFVLLRRWLGEFWAAFLGSAVFLLHPVQVQSVAWITQRSSLASTTCLLAAMIYLPDRSKSPGGGEWVVGIALAAAALLFRETPIVFPLLFVLMVAARRNMSVGQIWRDGSLRTDLFALGSVTLLYLIVRWGVLHHWSQLPDAGESLSANASLGLLALPVYLGKIILPISLRANYAYPSPNPVWIALALLGCFLYIAGTVYTWRLDRWVAAGLFWILISLLPVLQIVPIRAFVAERFLYLPMVGAAIVIGRISAPPKMRCLCLLWLLFLLDMTWQVVPAWKNESSLWAEAVRQEPNNVFARLCYGDALRDPDAAYRQYRQVLLIRPDAEQHFMAANNLANILLQQKKNVQALIWARAALAQKPKSPEALYNLTQAALRSGRREEAKLAFQRLENIAGPESPVVRSLRGEFK